MAEFERLFSPIRVGRMELKNRIVMPAMHHLYTINGLPTERFTEYYSRRAEGGAGLIVVGACRFDGYGAKASTMSLVNDMDIGPWKQFTDEIHARGGHVAVQLYHAGRYMRRAEVPAGDEALAPSAAYTPYTRETAREMSLAEIKRTVYDWALAARRAADAGFDAVEISGSAGYLIPQFLSPVTNLRQDAYGGSVENRHRFPLEVISAVRKAVGEGYPLILRLGGNDLIEGGCTPEDAAYFALTAERAGINMIDLTGGWHESRVPQLTGDVPYGGLTYMAEVVKEALTIPLAMANRLGDPYTAEETLALGRADMIAMGRPLIADPELPNKIRRGRLRDIRRCVGCNQGCLASTFFDKPIKCLVNAMAGQEYSLGRTPRPAEAKRILVVGGGVAGCEFAVNAAARGHRVSLWEKASRLGGQLDMVAALPMRRDFADITEYHEHMLAKLGVDVSLGTEARRDDILSGGFDAVVLATGRVQKEISLPRTEDSVPIYAFAQVLRRERIPGKDVVVVGGSFVACETARFLSLRGSLDADKLYYFLVHGVEPVNRTLELLNSSSRKVSIIDRARIGTGYESGVAWTVMKDLGRLKVRRYPLTTVVNVTSRAVVAMQADADGGEKRLVIPCDSVVMAVGSTPDTELYEAIREKVETYVIGGARKLGRAIDHIEEALTLAYEI